MKQALTATALALATLSSACANVEEHDPIDGTFTQPLTSAENDGVLSLVNDCSTTLSMLDVDAALDVRAATGIVARRDDADGACGTADDQPFATMADLDAVPWVGDVALSRLLAYATLMGYVSDSNDGLADAYDGVAFSLAEANGVLAIANGASLEILDDDIGLDSRAAHAIVLARPFDEPTAGANMQRLAAASYVGATALTRLKEYIAPWSACSMPAVTVNGVDFSNLETHDALDLVNQAPTDILTDISGIGSITAGKIEAARPFETLDQLGAIDGIGSAIVGHLHDELNVRWCPLLGARCGCPANASYRPPFVAFDENGLYYFLSYGEPWQAERDVDSGSVSHDSSGVVLTGVEVPDDPDNWQAITVQVFDWVWDASLQYQYTGSPIPIGRTGAGALHLGRVINTHDGKPYVLAYWQDVDDASFGWLFAKDASGAWTSAGEVYLN